MSDVKTLREKRGVGILPAFILAYSILIRFRIFLLTQEEEVNLGTKDSKAKEYLSDNTRFSEICNYVLFDGDKVIKPEDLKDVTPQRCYQFSVLIRSRLLSRNGEIC